MVEQPTVIIVKSVKSCYIILNGDNYFEDNLDFSDDFKCGPSYIRIFFPRLRKYPLDFSITNEALFAILFSIRDHSKIVENKHRVSVSTKPNYVQLTPS